MLHRQEGGGAETGPFPVQRCCKTQEEASVGAVYDRAFFLESNEIRAVIQNGGNGGTNTCTHLPRSFMLRVDFGLRIRVRRSAHKT